MLERFPDDEPDDFWTRTTSPDGMHAWIVEAMELRMSYWIMGGTLWRRAPAAKLFTGPRPWSFHTRTWVSSEVLELSGKIGIFPSIVLTLDVRAGCGTITCAWCTDYIWRAANIPAPPSEPQAFEDLRRWLEAFPSEYP